jgi:ribosomal protein L40E
MSLEELKQMKVSTDQLGQREIPTDQLNYIDKEVKDTIIDKRIKELEAEKVKKLLPKEIICPKCSAPNPFKNDQCMYCCYDLDKTKYYDLEYYESKKTYNSKQNEEQEDSYVFQYVISFLIPLVGFIIGGMLLSSDSKERVSVGKKCILIGIIAMAIASIGIAIIVNSNMNSNTILNNITRIR